MNHVIEKLLAMAAGLLDEAGVFPHVLVYERSDGTTNIEFIDFREPLTVLCHCLDRLIEERPKYLAFGMDRFSLPDQGVNTSDFLAVYFWDDGGWRFGICEYESKLKEIRWDCDFWKKRMEGEIRLGLNHLLKMPPKAAA